MAFDWLFGPPVWLRTPYIAQPQKYVPARIVDIDTVMDLADVMDAKFGARATRFLINRPQQQDEVTRESLRGVAPVDFTRLILQATRDKGLDSDTAIVSFGRHEPYVWAMHTELPHPDTNAPGHTETDHALENELIRRLSESGRRLVNWRPIIASLVFAPALVLAVSWIAAEVAGDVRGALHVFGWVMVGLVALAGAYAFRQLAEFRKQRRGHLIRVISREAIAADRANARRDVRVAVITAPIGIGAGVALTFLTNMFGLK